METLETSSLTEKVARRFYCQHCDYLTYRKNNYDKHLLTRKHQKSSNGNTGNTFLKKVAQPSSSMNKCGNISQKKLKSRDMCKEKSSKKKVAQGFNCSWCNKYYKSRSGCYKHEGKCNNKLLNLENKVNMLENDVKNEKLKKTINNNITIQLFLDENCGNAMPLENFVKNLRINMEDLFNSNKIGYVEGISSIIVKNLQELEFTERPIHCCDPKKLNFFIKSEKEWKKDNGEIVGKAVENVKKEVNGTVSKFMKNNESSEAEQMEIMKILQLINKIPPSISERNQIIKKIGDSVVIDNSFNSIEANS
tara:strand:+ start:390 stop:1310 length:921 start_codon:yes stop_codon:yes gene_type:complete